VLTIQERVEKGFDALTAYWEGTFWVDRVDVLRLNVEDVRACPLFFVFGGYIQGLEALGVYLGNDTIDHGFELDNYGSDCENEELTAEWVRRINEVPAGL
jgi:hypothetical protein